jgi:hypothetical protein
MNNLKKYLFFSSVGDRTNSYESWNLHENSRNKYDIALTYYGKDPARAKLLEKECDFFHTSHDSKFQNWAKVYADYIDQYEYFALFDDDIFLKPQQISRCFDIIKGGDYNVGSPSHHPAGQVSWPIMAKQKNSKIRRTNFIEMTAIFLSWHAMHQFMDVYKEYSNILVGHGIDWIIANVCDGPFCVIDEIHVVNPPRTPYGIEALQPAEERKKIWKEILKNDSRFKEFTHSNET